MYLIASVSTIVPTPPRLSAVTARYRRQLHCADCVRQSLATASVSMPDLSDEQLPLAVDDVPGIRTTQVCSPERVDDTSRIHLTADIGYPPSVTSRECPHGYTDGWSCQMSWCGGGPSAAAARCPSSAVLLLALIAAVSRQSGNAAIRTVMGPPSVRCPGSAECGMWIMRLSSYKCARDHVTGQLFVWYKYKYHTTICLAQSDVT